MCIHGAELGISKPRASLNNLVTVHVLCKDLVFDPVASYLSANSVCFQVWMFQPTRQQTRLRIQRYSKWSLTKPRKPGHYEPVLTNTGAYKLTLEQYRQHGLKRKYKNNLTFIINLKTHILIACTHGLGDLV